MIEIASLLGVSYTGKSTLANGLVGRLAHEGLTADVIKKDEALKVLGRKRYGNSDKSGGYSVIGALKHGQIPSRELHGWMNERIHESLDLGHIAILEGGTRTRTAQQETLSGLEITGDRLGIFMLQLPFREVVHRARQRRHELGRYDDMLPVAVAKLVGQYRGSHSDDAPQFGDSNVIPLDASLSPAELVDITASHILSSRSSE